MSTDFHSQRAHRPAAPSAPEWPSVDVPLAKVDVAIVAESTYPYLKGGVSAVVHDIIGGNPDLTFGIIHLTWDRSSAHEELYTVPANVHWIRPIFLSMHEHRDAFMNARPSDLGMKPSGRRVLVDRLFRGLQGVTQGDAEPLWELYDEGLNPRTRAYPLWALLGTRELMEGACEQLAPLGLPLVDTFWLIREFFSLTYALLHDEFPPASVYHAHTTGHASLVAAAAARQHGTKFLLTEHNLYVRDTINMLLDRHMALPVTVDDWRRFEVEPVDRAWMAWWIELGRLCYPKAEFVTYLYPSAVTEASDLGAPIEKSVVIPNGVRLDEFQEPYEARLAAAAAVGDPDHRWNISYIARVVPIKGLIDLLHSVALLVEWGATNFHLDVLGPTDHTPAYFEKCRSAVRELALEEHVTFHGTVNVRERLGAIDLLVLPSYNEGQPVVVLEAMAAGVPIVGTNVGGMTELTVDHLTTPAGETWTECAVLVNPDYVRGMARALRDVMADRARYAELSRNARGRVEHFFQLSDVTGAYNRLYRELAGLPSDVVPRGDLVVPQRTPGPMALTTSPPASGDEHRDEVDKIVVAEAREQSYEPRPDAARPDRTRKRAAKR